MGYPYAYAHRLGVGMNYINGTKTETLRVLKRRLGREATDDDARDMFDEMEDSGWNWRSDSLDRFDSHMFFMTAVHAGIPCEE